MLMSFFSLHQSRVAVFRPRPLLPLWILLRISQERGGWVGGPALLTARHVQQKAENLLFLFV